MGYFAIMYRVDLSIHAVEIFVVVFLFLLPLCPCLSTEAVPMDYFAIMNRACTLIL